MKIDNVSIERFGVWSDARMTEFSPGLNVFYGPNGSGKTTLMQFVRSVLYGFPARNSERYIPAVHPGRQGGQIGFTYNNAEFALSRFSDGNEAGEMAVKADAKTSKYVRTLLSSVGEPAFNELFTVGYREADSFDLLTREALADRPDNWMDVPELQQVVSAISSVEKERGELVNGNKPARIRKLVDRREQLCAEIAQLSDSVTAPDDSVQRLVAELEQIEAEIELAQRELNSIRDVAPQVVHSTNSLCQPAVPVGLTVTEDIRLLDQQILNWRRRCREIDEDLVRAQQQIEQLHHIGQEWAEGPQLANIDRTRDCVQELKVQIRELQSRLGIAPDVNTVNEYWQDDVQNLRDRVFELCREVGRQELLQRRRSVNSEIRQLRRVRSEMKRQLRILIRRRRFLIDSYGVENDEFRTKAVVSLCNCASKSEYCCSQTQSEVVRFEQPDNSAQEKRREVLRQRLKELHYRRDQLLAQLEAARTKVSDDDVEQRIERLLLKLNMVEEQILRSQQRYRSLSASLPVLQQLRADYEMRRQPVILKEASEYLRRLTDNKYRRILPDETVTGLIVERSDAQKLTLQGLSRGTRDQVALSLRLAVASAYRRRDQQVPIVLDDALLTSDDNRAEAVATLLRDYAAGGQQIVVFTCREQIAQMFRSLDVGVRNIPGLPVAAAPIVKPAPQPVMPQVVLPEPPKFTPIELVATQPVMETPAPPEPVAEPAPVYEPAPAAQLDTPGNWIFYLETTSDFDDFESMDSIHYEAMLRNGVRNVDDLLAVVPDAAAVQMADAGITAEQIRAWQTQAMLSCRVPMLRVRDARLLTMAGITNPEQLARMHPEELYAQVSRYLQSENGNQLQRRNSPFDMQTAISWIRYSRHARTLWDSRDGRSSRPARRFDRGLMAQTEEQSGANFLRQPAADSDNGGDYDRDNNRTRNREGYDYDRDNDGDYERDGSDYDRDDEGGSSEQGERRMRSPLLNSSIASGGGSSSSSSSSSSRSSTSNRSGSSSRSGRSSNRSRSSSSRSSSTRSSTRSNRSNMTQSARSTRSERQTHSQSQSSESTSGWKFYLNRKDPVEDGPSIGPKTAERLAAAGIYTVDDLLNCDVDNVVATLKNRRINNAKLTAWQQQASLCCQIPQLRGHDAQILVACEIDDPQQISTMRPNDLFAIVAPFVATPEGERIVRNGKKPDLEEITDWITWAQNARALSAA